MNDKKTTGRDENGRFIKGVSGNPGGKPPTPEDVKEMLKASTAPAVKLLVDTMINDTTKPELRVKCAEILIDRVMGKAVQPLEAVFTAPTLELSDFTVDELRRLAAYGETEETDDSTSGE